MHSQNDVDEYTKLLSPRIIQSRKADGSLRCVIREAELKKSRIETERLIHTFLKEAFSGKKNNHIDKD